MPAIREMTATAPRPRALSVAVSIPDQREGELIVLLTTQKDAKRTALQRQAKTVGASELAVPATIRMERIRDGTSKVMGAGRRLHV
jgi:acyl-[acyl-carrier-protein]-phospholipid O-acyltransferase/long-chain-fatty-acid--[acyl-carrier-protein] ligase